MRGSAKNLREAKAFEKVAGFRKRPGNDFDLRDVLISHSPKQDRPLITQLYAIERTPHETSMI
jgi:hypothetical protein